MIRHDDQYFKIVLEALESETVIFDGAHHEGTSESFSVLGNVSWGDLLADFNIDRTSMQRYDGPTALKELCSVVEEKLHASREPEGAYKSRSGSNNDARHERG